MSPHSYRRAACAIAGCVLASCATPPEQRQRGADSDALSSSRDAIARAEPQDQLLARMRYAVDALEVGESRAALHELAFLQKATESVFSNLEGAQKARSLWYGEGRKEFRGEMYERAMVGYYYGLALLLRGDRDRGDYGNAQAAFAFGAMQDSFAEEKQYASDFALLYYLRALALLHDGSEHLAHSDPLPRLAKLRPDLAPPDPSKNVLLIVETGTAPRKVTDGKHNAELRYFRGRGFRENGAVAKVNGSALPLYPIEDIWWQATTRGGRKVDVINQGKVVWAQRLEDVGTVLTTAGQAAVWTAAVVGEDAQAVAVAGGAVGLAGSISLITASMIDASADDRYWDNLPDAVHVLQLSLPHGQHRIDVEFLERDGPDDPGRLLNKPAPQSIELNVDDRPLQVVWVRSRQQLKVRN